MIIISFHFVFGQSFSGGCFFFLSFYFWWFNLFCVVLYWMVVWFIFGMGLVFISWPYVARR